MITFTKSFCGQGEDYRKNLACIQEVTDRLLSHMKGHGYSFRQEITDGKGSFSQEKLCSLVKELVGHWAETLRKNTDKNPDTGESLAEPYIRERRELYGLYLYLVMRCSLCEGAYAKAYPYGPVSRERTDFAFLLEQARRLSGSWCVMAKSDGSKKNELYEGFDLHFGFHLYKTLADPQGTISNSTLSPQWSLPRDHLAFLTNEGSMKRLYIKHSAGFFRSGKAAEAALAKETDPGKETDLDKEADPGKETDLTKETDLAKEASLDKEAGPNEETAAGRGTVRAEGAAPLKAAVRAEDAAPAEDSRSEDGMTDTEGCSGTDSAGGYEDHEDSDDYEDDFDYEDDYDYDAYEDYDDDDPYPFPDFESKAEFEAARMDQLAEEYERADYLAALALTFACQDEYFEACGRFAALFGKARPDVLRGFYQELEEIVNLYLAERNLSPLTDTDKTLDVYGSVYDGPCRQADSYERRLQWENQ